MVRSDLEGIPQHALGAPWRLRMYRPGDVANWVRIESAAERYREITPRLFERQFGMDPGELGERQFYLCDEDGEAIGTATAWHSMDEQGENWGRVHWVCIVPEWQGRGLSKPLLTAVCNRMRELGHRRAYLMTETVRVAAIHLYRSFGFRLEPAVEERGGGGDQSRAAAGRSRNRQQLG
jgi:GNAT superfamily N-acetyltransferase